MTCWHSFFFSGELILWVRAGPAPFPLLTYHIFMPIGCYTDPFPTPPETIIYIFSKCIFIGMCSYNVCITVLLSCSCFLVRQDSHVKLTLLKLIKQFSGLKYICNKYIVQLLIPNLSCPQKEFCPPWQSPSSPLPPTPGNP